MFRTIVPRNVRLAEAPSFGKPVLQHDKDSRGALAYLALAGEMLRKEDERRRIEPAVPTPPRPPTASIRRRERRSGTISSDKWSQTPLSSAHEPEETGHGSWPRGAARPDDAPARTGRRAGDARRSPRRPANKLPGDELANLPLDLLQRGKYQPRVDMRQESLQELADSIKAQGIVQPIVVRPVDGAAPGESQRYEIIAGERRWRAAQIAGLATVPAVIRRVPDEAAIAMALIENIQRENLNPLEEARALERLISEFGVTHQQAADAVGRSRAAVSNLLRLLELPPEISAFVEKRELEMGHARALARPHAAPPAGGSRRAGREEGPVGARDRGAGAQHAARRPPAAAAGEGQRQGLDPNVQRLQDELSEKLGALVQIQHSGFGQGQGRRQLPHPR